MGSAGQARVGKAAAPVIPTPRELADEFARQHLPGRGPNARTSTLIGACRALNCTVETVPLTIDSGRTLRSAQGGWAIQLAEGQGARRQRFTLCHEIGHLLLRTRDVTALDEERFCDEFASELLLPRSDVLRAVRNREHTLETASDLADDFRVTLPSAIVRLNFIAGWQVALVTFWNDEPGSWVLYSTSCAPSRERFQIRSGADCAAFLDSRVAGRFYPSVHVPFNVHGAETTLPCSVLRRGKWANVLIAQRHFH